MAGSHHVVGVGHAERNEQQTRLVDVAVVLIDDGDLDLVRRVFATGLPSDGRIDAVMSSPVAMITVDDLVMDLAADLSDLARPVTGEVLFGHHDSSVSAVI